MGGPNAKMSSDSYPSSDASDYDPDDIEQHFVELTETSSASEASALAARLRRAGIIALANAEPYLYHGSRHGLGQGFRTFVMVFEAELERAIEVVNAEIPDEGEASLSAIADDFEQAEQDPESAMSWFHEEEAKNRSKERRWLFGGAIVLGVIVIWLSLR